VAGKIIADIIEAPYDSIRMNVANVTVLTANSSGLTYLQTVNVNINIGGTNANLTMNLLTANGIKFPATQVSSADGNTLDDYEEGTFTPTWTPASGSGATVNVANGYYTKVGNVVTVVFRLGTNGHGTSSGNITIGGLPFVVSSLTNNLGVFCVGQAANMAITAGQNMVGQNINGTTNINPVLWNVTTGTQTITATQWGVSGVMWFSGSYFI
jgi:hypothetical protein